MGQMLQETQRAKGAKGVGPVIAVRGSDRNEPPTLAELGVSKNESARAQEIAALPAETFEAVRAGLKTITQARRDAKEAQREARREANRRKVSTAAPAGKIDARFASIVIDPPWDWGDEGDVDQMGQMLQETERAKGILKRGPVVTASDRGEKAPTLKELGVLPGSRSIQFGAKTLFSGRSGGKSRARIRYGAL